MKPVNWRGDYPGIALGRLGSPADIANLVVFLATSEPIFITGQTFVVDGFQFHV